MQVLVTFRHVEPTAALREYAEQKVTRLNKYLRRTSDAHVVLSVEKQRHKAEITVQARGNTLAATESTKDLYSAIDLALDKLERQAKKLAAKHKDRKHQGRPPAAPAPRAAARPRRGVLEAERVEVKPMSVDEAVHHMKVQDADFIFFQNDATETLCLLYRRRDGKYGLVEPEVP